jgi:hypothetical protein
MFSASWCKPIPPESYRNLSFRAALEVRETALYRVRKKGKNTQLSSGAVCIRLRRTVILMNLDALARFDENASLALSWISLAFRGYLPKAPGKSIKVQWPPRIASDSIERFHFAWFGGVCES